MKRVLLLVLWLVYGYSWAATAPTSQKSRLQFDRIPVVDLIQIYYSEIDKSNYVASAQVFAVDDKVSVVFDSGSKASMREVFLQILLSAGLDVVKKNGVDYIHKAKAPEVDLEVLVYRPRFRDMTYFSDLLSSIFRHGRFTFQRGGVPTPPRLAGQDAATTSGAPASKTIDTGTSAYSLQNKSFDVLIFQGPPEEVAKLRKFLDDLDMPEGQVQIAAYVYEFSSSVKDANGIGVIADLLVNNGVKLAVNAGSPAAANLLKFNSTSGRFALNVVAQSLATDGRFKVLSRPYVRVKSGASARFTSGDEVPVLGVAQLDKSGNPVQSVEYRSSGVILDVVPTVRGDVIDLSILQQLSNFVPTQNGVNNSPTLLKREVKTGLVARSGEVVVLGGLVSSRTNRDESKLFGLIPVSWSDSEDKAEILVVLEVQRIE